MTGMDVAGTDFQGISLIENSAGDDRSLFCS